jgi:hypothetical protein
MEKYHALSRFNKTIISCLLFLLILLACIDFAISAPVGIVHPGDYSFELEAGG